MTKQEIILDFIKQFRDLGAENCFANGMCWHFTLILRTRFGYDNMIIYDPIANHFAVEIDDRYYDITGDITDNKEYNWVYWMTYCQSDRKEYNRIHRDCIHKLPAGIITCEYCKKAFRDDTLGCIICDLDHHPCDPNESCEKGVSICS